MSLPITISFLHSFPQSLHLFVWITDFHTINLVTSFASLKNSVLLCEQDAPMFKHCACIHVDVRTNYRQLLITEPEMALIEECLICFEDMAVFYTTNCGHKYCYSCVKQITTCSYCRQPITDVKPPAYLSCVKGLRRLDPSILKAINGDKEMFSDIIDASGIFNVIHEPTFDQPVFEKYVFPMLEGRRQQMEYFIASQYVAIGENIIRWKYGVCGVFEAGNVTAFDEIWKMV